MNTYLIGVAIVLAYGMFASQDEKGWSFVKSLALIIATALIWPVFVGWLLYYYEKETQKEKE